MKYPLQNTVGNKGDLFFGQLFDVSSFRGSNDQPTRISQHSNEAHVNIFKSQSVCRWLWRTPSPAASRDVPVESCRWCSGIKNGIRRDFLKFVFVIYKNAHVKSVRYVHKSLTSVVGIPTLSAAEKANEKFLLFSFADKLS